MVRRWLIVMAGLLYAAASQTYASPQCPQFFLKAQAPHAGIVLCNTAYAVGYSKALKVPLWSAEHLTDASVTRAQSLHGRGSFFVDGRLPAEESAMRSDYRGSGYVRGHMTPSGDMQDRQARMQTFAYSNIVPQDAGLNSGPWNQIEQDTRRAALNDGELYVITGPILPTSSETIGSDHIIVPVALFKVVYNAMDDTSTAIICNNDTPAQCRHVSLQTLQALIGFNPLPGLNGHDTTARLTIDGWSHVIKRSWY